MRSSHCPGQSAQGYSGCQRRVSPVLASRSSREAAGSDSLSFSHHATASQSEDTVATSVPSLAMCHFGGGGGGGLTFVPPRHVTFTLFAAAVAAVISLPPGN